MNIFAVILFVILILWGGVSVYVSIEQRKADKRVHYLRGQKITDEELMALTKEELQMLTSEQLDWLVDYAARQDGKAWLELFKRASRIKYPHRVPVS